MASKKTLNAKNLEALGAERLSQLLIQISAGDAAAKRLLRLELAGAQSPAEVARAVRKRLTTIGRSHSFVDGQNRRALVEDLEAQHRAIVDRVAKFDPGEALDLLWRFLELANRVLARCDDRGGAVSEVFRAACGGLGAIAAAAKVDPERLADRVFAVLGENDYGQHDGLIKVLAPVLGSAGLEHLKARIVELSKTPVATPPPEKRKAIGWIGAGPIYADQLDAHSREHTIRVALQAIADAQGDVDGFIALQSEKAKTVPRVAADIARRLLAAGRAQDAWSAINAVEDARPGWIPFEWEQTRLDVLEALGRADEAQAFRWACFERSLRTEHLRAHLKRLPAFDDIAAEERALALAQAWPEVHQALAFLVSWPALDRAADVVVRRVKELNGDHYEILAPAADALAEKHPLAATILLRSMIDFALKESRATRYRHAARHLADCAGLATTIGTFGAFETHDAYVARLSAEHGRKSAFWSLVS
jgi:hypothetical protein